jgi:hypothetical protein
VVYNRIAMHNLHWVIFAVAVLDTNAPAFAEAQAEAASAWDENGLIQKGPPPKPVAPPLPAPVVPVSSAWDENGLIEKSPGPAAVPAPAGVPQNPRAPSMPAIDAHQGRQDGHGVKASPKPPSNAARKSAPGPAPAPAAHPSPQKPGVTPARIDPHASPEAPAKKPASKPNADPASTHGTAAPLESNPKPGHGEKAKTGTAHKSVSVDSIHDENHHGKNTSKKQPHGKGQPPDPSHGKTSHASKHDTHAPTHDTHAPTHDTHAPTHDVHAPAHESHAPTNTHGTEPNPGGHHHDSHEENKPLMQPKPDTTFARSVDWNKGTAEVLAYEVKRLGKAGEGKYQGRLVTERMYLQPNGLADRKPAGRSDVEILNAVLAYSGEDGGIPFSSETVVKMPRRESFRLLKQDQSLQSWPGATHRSLDCRPVPPILRVQSSGGEIPRDTVLSRWPVYTEEMLFTYLRALPQRAGYREEVWLQDWAGEGRLPIRPQFATISVRSRTASIRDMETWYITVDREDGRRSEFWVSAAGMHPVVMAILADRTTWTLQEISRRKYWNW